jgi:hypothetical protein
MSFYVDPDDVESRRRMIEISNKEVFLRSRQNHSKTLSYAYLVLKRSRTRIKQHLSSDPLTRGKD